MTVSLTEFTDSHWGRINPDFESLVQRIIQTVDKDKLADLRKDFHTRLRITLTQPDNAELIEDLWDFFYDWCLFEQKLPETLHTLTPDESKIWEHVKGANVRGLFAVVKASEESLKLKELFSGVVYYVKKKGTTDFIGISRGDFIEGRLVSEPEPKTYSFIRRPSYHPSDVHSYIKKKVRQFKRAKDADTYQNWLWLLVGMYLKHRIYHHMPIDKIYDDNSRI